ncbi:MAG: KamA family radical SAM protein [Bdellovibrio sp.]|nr:KamA family radical SAM protein [Bdellovibrio sp.]
MKLTYTPSPKPESVSSQDWDDWTWQLRHSLKSEKDFSTYFDLAESERKVFATSENAKEVFNIRTTPYYASLASKTIVNDPIRRILVPHEKELFDPKQAMLDPLGERKSKNNPVPRIIHRYSDRVLFLITDICSVYCRYCTRKHFTGSDQAFIKNSEYENAIEYIRKTTGLREVILSGGDPLTISDGQLERVLIDLRAIDHVEIIRIGTRMPVVAPMRVTDNLVKIIKKAKPVFLMTHFNHPRELTSEAAEAVERFVDNGIPVMNQMVLLNGVNNHPAIVQALSRRLLYLRAKPYYMFQCDPSIGTDYLRTTIEDSLQIQKELWGHLSGLAMPNLAVDIPDGGGKTYYTPDFETSSSLEKRSYIGWDGVEADYVNPEASHIVKPLDYELYLDEWESLKAAKK